MFVAKASTGWRDADMRPSLRRMDWDKAYDNSGAVGGSEGYVAAFTADAAAYRETARARLDLAYGKAERERLDLFLPEGRAKGLAVFIHGGYWMKFAKDAWSHLAAGPLALGWAVAMPSYTLCPDIRIAGITRQIARAVRFAADQVDGPIALAGHSAGGHLASRMVCADTALPQELQARLGPALSISGVHDLRPLMRTELNASLCLDETEAISESPALQQPLPGTRLACWVGANERPEFVRQNALLANIWTGLGAETQVIEEAGRHHFDVIDGLVDPGSAMIRAWLGEG